MQKNYQITKKNYLDTPIIKLIKINKISIKKFSSLPSNKRKIAAVVDDYNKNNFIYFSILYKNKKLVIFNHLSVEIITEGFIPLTSNSRFKIFKN